MRALRTNRGRRLLAVAALLTAAAPAALLATAGRATAASSLDVYAVHGDATAVRVTVQTGYSFVVEPDAMLPRAAAQIEADQVSALASPLDPGDSVDALPGLGVPTAEQDITQGAQTPFPSQSPIPSPPAGATPPPQFSSAVGTAVTTFASLFNPTLTAPYEHAVATYPNPGSSGPQRASFPPGSADNVPPDFPDLLHLLSVHSSSGSAVAAEGSGSADAGVGSAVEIPGLGLSIGRISSHVDVSGNTGPAIAHAVTTLQNVDLVVPAPPSGVPVSLPVPAGTHLLHIGTLVLDAVTRRDPGASKATSQTSLEASGVTVMGQAARLDQHGLSLNGSPSPLNAPVSQLIGMLSSPTCAPDPPVGVPNGPALPVAEPVLKIGPPTVADNLSHNGNERNVVMNGPTLCLATITPVPNTSSLPSPTPTIYTITLGSLDSGAYGVSLPADSGGSAFLPVLSTTGGAGGSAAIPSTTTTTPGTAGGAAGAPATGSARPGGLRGLLATLTGGILSPKVVVTVATLAELALLGTLWLSYRLAAARRDDESPSNRMDLV